MDSKAFSLFSDFKLTSTKLRLSDSDFVDRLNHYFAALVFCVSSIVICTHQYLVGEPLECWVPKEFSSAWEQYAENYCWVENTYFVNRNASLRKDHHSELKYYQWVPFVLVLQALLFYLPYYFWRSVNWISGVDIHHMMLSGLDASSSTKAKKENAIKSLVEQYQDSFLERSGKKFRIKSGCFLTYCYIITKFLYVVDIVCQFVLTSSFLNTNFFIFGVKILNYFTHELFWDETGLFPRTTFCQFDIRTIDKDRPYTIQCVLVVNMLVEKVYIFLWFVMAFLFVANSFTFLQWLAWFIMREKPVLGGLTDVSSKKKAVWDKMNIDSLLVLRMLKKNCLGLSYFGFIREFTIKTELDEFTYEMEPI